MSPDEEGPGLRTSPCHIFVKLRLSSQDLVCLRFHPPGTKWCGVDDVADSYFDLGKFYEMDKCCRAHDFCPMKIKGFSKKYGTINFKPYTA